MTPQIILHAGRLTVTSLKYIQNQIFKLVTKILQSVLIKNVSLVKNKKIQKVGTNKNKHKFILNLTLTLYMIDFQWQTLVM